MNVFGVASDVHLHNWTAFKYATKDGVNSRLRIILNSLEEAATAVVRAGGDRLVITGDLFHVRGSIAPSVINPALETFKKLNEIGIKSIEILAGNHDLESKDSTQLTNANGALAGLDFVTVISEPLFIEKHLAIHIPWVDDCEELMKELQSWVDIDPEKAKEFDVFIHAPMDDVLPNMPGHGLNPDDLKALGFHRIFCGHYHNHKEVRANVFSVGALTHQTWGDVNSKAGFVLVVDDEVQHFETDAPRFVDWDNELNDPGDIIGLCSGNYVRVKLDEADPSEIREFREYITNDCGALDCVIQALPKSKVVARKGGVKKAASLRDNVTNFIDSKTMSVNKADVQRAAEDILSTTGAV